MFKPHKNLSVDSQENNYNCSSQCYPRLPRGPTSKAKGRKGKGGRMVTGREGRKREGNWIEIEVQFQFTFLTTPLMTDISRCDN